MNRADDDFSSIDELVKSCVNRPHLMFCFDEIECI